MLSLFHSLFHSPWNILIASFLTHKYLSTKYPLQYENFCYNCAYYSINLYSKAQIFFLKIKPRVTQFLEPILQIDFLKNIHLISLSLETLEFIKDGKVIYQCLREKFNENKEIAKDVPTKFDFILYSSPDSESSEIINKKILYDYPLKQEDFIIEKTNYVFMLTEISLDAQEPPIKIDLITKKYNYFIVNNKINAAFLTYFLMEYKNFYLSSDKSCINNYVIKIIDENINMKTVNGFALEEIWLNENNFEIGVSPRHFDITTSFEGKKISDYISFSHSGSDSDADLPNLIPIEDNVVEEDKDYVESFSFI